ncbi:hypothetical protein AMAG_08817 [Allomyces macrogynus ATCC 38327]|uniref:Uncharacterized protein n=1 Tax=Allomyces macrogynus (strain ATCC 38327) TaxID=578462 RepID=A0A0L0SML9_ALLM3|nr:hypothetical protein AMAG_08817 [Allomyces macrogynus ATCC 38327]|eukprot:KNE63732.1 hypothetical protein AMAG_08817 [Allomyces macrogynus ATCC 38327]
MTDAQFKKLIELDSDVKFVADAIYWNGPAGAERKKCMAHNSYKAKSCIRSIIKRSAQADLANVKGLFTKPMLGSGAAAVHEHIADLQRRFHVNRRHERAKSSLHLHSDFADSFLVLALLSSLPPEYSPTVLLPPTSRSAAHVP